MSDLGWDEGRPVIQRMVQATAKKSSHRADRRSSAYESIITVMATAQTGSAHPWAQSMGSRRPTKVSRHHLLPDEGLHIARAEDVQPHRSAVRFEGEDEAKEGAALPPVFTGIKIAITFSVIGAVLGEWVGASQGLGYLLLQSTAQFLTARGIAVLVVLSAMGIVLFVAVSLLQRLLMPWWREEVKRRVGPRA